MLRKIILAVSAITLSLYLNAQIASTLPTTENKEGEDKEEVKPTLTITGSVDAYFKYDFAKTKANNYTSFTGTQNSFSLGMASVKFEHTGDKIGAVLDLGFGPRASEFNYNDAGILSAVKQMYVTYSPTDWLKFSAGTWGTHVGYELLDPQLNKNYSMSYMFTNGPFSHTGLKADITKGKHGFMVGVANATDFRVPLEDQINKKFFLAQYSLAASDDVSIYVNYVTGKAPDTSVVSQVDAVVTAQLSDKFSIGFNGTVNSTKFWDGAKNIDQQSWWGSALYLNLDPKPWLGLTLRGEYFNDDKQLKMFSAAPAGGNIFATTLSANFKKGGFTFIPEFRIDNASEEIFIDKAGAGKKSAANFIVAAIYSF